MNNQDTGIRMVWTIFNVEKCKTLSWGIFRYVRVWTPGRPPRQDSRLPVLPSSFSSSATLKPSARPHRSHKFNKRRGDRLPDRREKRIWRQVFAPPPFTPRISFWLIKRLIFPVCKPIPLHWPCSSAGWRPDPGRLETSSCPLTCREEKSLLHWSGNLQKRLPSFARWTHTSDLLWSAVKSQVVLSLLRTRFRV